MNPVTVSTAPSTNGATGEPPLLRIAIVGTGHGGWSLIRVLSRIPKVQVVGLCDVNPDATRPETTGEVEIPRFRTVNDLVRITLPDWLINVTNSSITQRHLLTLDLGRPVNVLDGAAAEVVWRFLAGMTQQADQCPPAARECSYDMAWSLITLLAGAMWEMQHRITDIAFYDSLTGLYSRRIMLELLERELRNSIRQACPLSVMILDIDNFRQINEQYGHAAGDALLQELAEILRRSHRPGDILARIGGEELVAILPFTRSESTVKIAERLLARIPQTITTPGGAPLTVSIGVADTNALTDKKVTATTVLDWADHALRHAKSSGRNRVVAHETIRGVAAG